jgi:hypothetical protein
MTVSPFSPSSTILSFSNVSEFRDEVVVRYERTKRKPIVLLDLDGTTIRPKDHLLRADACAMARGGRVLGLKEEILAMNRALEVARYELVEQEMPQVIADLRKRGIPVEGLTARGESSRAATTEQLASVGITMDVHFSHGQLKAGNMDAIVQLHPDCDAVAFGDDSFTQLLSVATKTRQLGKDFLGHHSQANEADFDYSDDLNFPRMRQQLRYFMDHNKWVSDEDWLANVKPT